MKGLEIGSVSFAFAVWSFQVDTINISCLPLVDTINISCLPITSIKENILVGKPGAFMEEVTEASKAENAYSFIGQLPDGYNTQVGQSGSQMSGGAETTDCYGKSITERPKNLVA